MENSTGSREGLESSTSELSYTPELFSLANHKGLESKRLQDSLERKADWKNWGTYVSEREWSTVREDYSSDGDVWNYFTHDQARSRAYRWGEDGIGGFCNRYQNVCIGLAFWNTQDPIIKERLFGLTGPEGNHGEDVKEHYFYLDNTPTHSYAKMLYKYPMNEYPYEQLIRENAKRGKREPEFELEDTGIFDNDEYFDIFIEYAKADQEDILCRVRAYNRSKTRTAPLHILPHLWFRNTWSWGYNPKRPYVKVLRDDLLEGEESHIGKRWYTVTYDNGESEDAPVEYLFTENDTNTQRLFNWPSKSPYVKDGINNSVVKGWKDCVNQSSGTKVAANCSKMVAPGDYFEVKIRFANYELDEPWKDFDKIFEDRIFDADEYYDQIHGKDLSLDLKMIQRQALAGLLWSKQYYHFGVDLWKKGDPSHPRPNPSAVQRNAHWDHYYANDVISMPDAWEYPWPANWDTAFHMISLVMIDSEWAKRQLILATREWFMSPNGQIPAYEFQFSDVNPPVHAWASLEIYRYILKKTGHKDLDFLEEIFHKLLLNFTWWVNRKDVHGNNIFEGGFLGLDNISVFDRSAPLPGGGRLEQADGTAWMGLYSLNMLAIALEIAKERKSYESIATKFLEHFIYIANSITSKHKGDCKQQGLWNEEEGFFFDSISMPNGESHHLKVQSLVGLVPLMAVDVMDQATLDKLPRFKERLEWFVRYRPHLVEDMASFMVPGQGKKRLLSIVNKQRLEKILTKMLDPDRFLSESGIRSLSKHHGSFGHPFVFNIDGASWSIQYDPGESTSGLFGGNSNWRGPVWICMNYLLIQSLKHYYSYYGDEFLIEYPTGSKNKVTLDVVQKDLSQRLVSVFTKDSNGIRRYSHDKEIFAKEHWRDHILFHEYFHGDNGLGLGASHQLGWTSLVAKLIEDLNEKQI